MQDISNEVVKFMDEQKLTMATLGGHGFGAKDALATAINNMDRCTGVVNLDGGPLDHTYYEASAITTDFIARGGEALKYVEADNGGGDLNIIAQGLSLKPISPKPMTILLAETAPQEITIEFPESLSSFAQLPRFEV